MAKNLNFEQNLFPSQLSMDLCAKVAEAHAKNWGGKVPEHLF